MTPTTPTTVLLSLASNEDAAANMRAMAAALRTHDPAARFSAVYESADVAGDGAPYLNAGALLTTTLDAARFKTDVLVPIEDGLGRVHGGSVIRADIDIVLFGALVGTVLNRTLPHPNLVRQAFVAVPLAVLAPEVLHPVTGERLADIAGRLAAQQPLALRADVVLA